MRVGKLEQLVTVGEIPDSDRIVVACTGDSTCMFVNREAPDEVRVSGEGVDAFARLGQPELDLPVVRAGREEPAVRRDGDAGESAVVAREDAEAFTSRCTPELDA